MLDPVISTPPACFGNPDGFSGPGDHLAFHFDCRMVAAAAIGVEDRNQKFGQQPCRGAAAIHPPHEARMLVARAIRQNKALEIGVEAIEAGALMRQRPPEFRAFFGRHLLPDRPVAGRLQPVQHVIEHAMAERAHGVPILRVQIGAGIGHGGCDAMPAGSRQGGGAGKAPPYPGVR